MSSNGSSVDESPSSSSAPEDTSAPLERNRGEQPLAKLLVELTLKHSDLVEAAKNGVTHKMVGRAAKGRWLTMHSRLLVLDALNRACKGSYRLSDLFNY